MQYGHARYKMPPELEKKLTSDMYRIIAEANLGKESTHIAQRYYIDQVAQIDIAAELGVQRSTISRRIKRITPQITNAAMQLPRS